MEVLLRADTDLHKMIISHCGNGHLRDMLSNLYSLVQVFRVAGYGSRQRSTEATRDHLEIIEALLEVDGEQAEARMRGHIEKTKQQIVHEFEAKQAETAGA